jgi:hypothetical protein
MGAKSRRSAQKSRTSVLIEPEPVADIDKSKNNLASLKNDILEYKK